MHVHVYQMSNEHVIHVSCVSLFRIRMELYLEEEEEKERQKEKVIYILQR